MRTKIDIHESAKIDLNECEYFLKATESEIDPTWIILWMAPNISSLCSSYLLRQQK